jgi:hypothetical protein
VWNVGGDVCNHSKLDSTPVSDFAVNNSAVCHWLFGATLFADKASYITYTKTITPIKEIKLPIELTAFQPAKPSA